VAVLALVWADLGETAVLRPMRLSDQLREYPDLLRAPRFWGYCLASAFASGAFFAYLGGAPFVGLVVFGLDPAQLGLYFGAPALGYGTGNFLSGRYSRHFGLNRMILAGTLTTLAGISVLVLIEAAGGTTAAIFFGLSATVGLGNGLVMPNATAGMLSVRPHMAGTASGLGGFDSGWFTFGTIEWTSGANAGRRTEVLGHDVTDGIAVLTLLEVPVRAIAESDAFTIRAGCDKRIETCGAKFANTANFRGFPHIPGQDAVLRYATKDGGHEGGVL